MPHRTHTIIKNFRARSVIMTILVGMIPAVLTVLAPRIADAAGNHGEVHLALMIGIVVGWLFFAWQLLYTLLRLQPRCPECGRRMRKTGPHEDEEGKWSIANCLNCRRFFRFRGFGDGLGP